jgi:heterogeneous nuclear ribonucleoprotein L
MYWGGTNKLQIEFAWTTKLFVTVNDLQKSWDYTKTSGSYYQPQAQNNSYETAYQYGPQQQQQQQVYQNYNAPQYYDGTSAMPQQQQQLQAQKTLQPVIVFASAPLFQPNVMYVSGLNYETSNTDKLFNLLSLYGNVAKIQFLSSRPGTAIVQMFDSLSVDYCIRYLNNIPLGSHGKLQVYWANSNYVPNNSQPFTLPDGSGSYKEFTESKNQRFLVPRPSFWIQAPSRILRYYNTPSSVTEDNLVDLFSYKNLKPKQVRSLRMPADEESQMSRGLIEFSSVAQAVLAVMKCNNKDIRSMAKTVHYMKLCFSSSQSLDLKN